jgi:hypothetical protein
MARANIPLFWTSLAEWRDRRSLYSSNANAMLFNSPEGIPHIQVKNFSIHGDFAACSGKAVF